ncbi:MAG: Hsp20/alpha crystallin family protein [Terriglobales bacterium]
MPTRALSRRDPFSSDILDFRRRLDEMLPRMFSLPLWERWSSSPDTAWIPPLDCYIDGNRFHVHMALPGVRPGDVNLQVHGNELSISGERKQEVTPSDERTFQREITYGAFERTTTLPEGVQTDKIEANFRNGVLEISAPMSEKAMPRKIEIKQAEGGKRLAA